MLAQRRQSRAPQLHADHQSREYAFHVALLLGLAAVPASAIGNWSGVALRPDHDHRIFIGLRFRDIAAHHLIKRLWKKLIAQIVAIEGDTSNSSFTCMFVDS